MFAENLWLAPVLPVISFLAIWPLGKKLRHQGAELGLLTVGAALLLALGALWDVLNGARVHVALEWIPGTPIEVGFLVDPVSSLMLVIVLTISFLVHLFSVGYMAEEGSKRRYYSGLSLFTASMAGLTVSSSVFLFFMFFELVGLCSYLLIGFHWETLDSARGAVRAFMVTKFGDLFFMAALAVIPTVYHTYDFVEMAERVHELPVGAATLVALLLLGGVAGKSAQFPLHTWLHSDRRLGNRGAMEGPTPVSALIHAATMVAAGVYLVIRAYPVFHGSPTALTVIAWMGGFTALYSAVQGAVSKEIKTVLAFSTISQYGYMMLGLGVGGFAAAMFHLMNHAFFKALLFLGAGSVIIATHHENNIWKMGGLGKRMPITAITFLAGGLALMGLFPFSGYFSKDLILEEAYLAGEFVPFLMGLIGVPFTAFYTTRVFTLTFLGSGRTESAEHAQETPWVMTLPLIILGLLALTSGFTESALFEGFISFEAAHEASAHVPHIPMPLISSVLVVGSALLGLGFYWERLDLSVLDPFAAKEVLGPLYGAVFNGFYQDYLQLGLVDMARYKLAGAFDSTDQRGVDGAVDGIDAGTKGLGELSSRIQTGMVQNYIGLFALGIAILAIYAGIAGGWLAW